jgi:hypothetical protein
MYPKKQILSRVFSPSLWGKISEIYELSQIFQLLAANNLWQVIVFAKFRKSEKFAPKQPQASEIPGLFRSTDFNPHS